MVSPRTFGGTSQPRGLGNHMGRTSFGNSWAYQSWRQTLRKSEAASGLTPDRCSTASFPLAQWVPMEPIAERTGGRQHNPSHLSTVGGTGCLAPNMGMPWWNSAKSWAAWTGNGRRQTGPWARHVWGGSDWTQPNGSRQGWQQAEPACGRTGRPIEHCGCRSQRPRRHVVG